ncbi:aminoglycoside phosphotransferase family protein [Pseudonocardia humida]|uniref:Aminoglycoside phosphotransferase family protein n=1 Tax=Pseudonocardia humida TaxID=2800819 RepID=A0ABT1A1W4_9PSEU|nr:phosphotransferase [Pseudonocardia humida]MCO1656985.1 aminoglycoside phosphotransferase family protein [Pseudonocardia humida]
MDREEIDAALAARLVAAQFPRWADLPVRPVEVGGWDNRTFRLGSTMSVRLPTAEGYVAAVAKEHDWLPRLAPHLPVAVPEPLALGAPGQGYPWPWSVRRWIEGRPAAPGRIGDPVVFARDLAAFLRALRRVEATGGPLAGAHSFHRGGDLRVYDAQTRTALQALRDRVDTDLALAVWESALAAPWTGPPVWFHGDVAAGNLLVDGADRLTAVIDFGTSGVGDPACDLVVCWTLLGGAARAEFREAVPADDAMWARGRGWALWKALITMAPGGPGSVAPDADAHAGVVRDVLAEHRAAHGG